MQTKTVLAIDKLLSTCSELNYHIKMQCRPSEECTAYAYMYKVCIQRVIYPMYPMYALGFNKFTSHVNG